MKNMKWQLMIWFFLASCIISAVMYVGFIFAVHSLPFQEIWWIFIAIVFAVNLVVGYYVSQASQRKVDELHLGLIQLAKGNLSNRIKMSANSSFYDIYEDYNTMADSMEEKIKLLQSLGEEHTMLQAETKEKAILDERKRLARDLHDSVSQELFAIHMAASSLPRIIEKDEAVAKQVINQLIEMSNHAQKQMRGLIAQLRPLELKDKSLTAALQQWFPDYCNQNQLQGSLELQLSQEMSEGKEHQLFLIIQEGMANIVKHASAKRVQLILQETAHQYVMSIIDDGIGFEREISKLNSFGLHTMRERAHKLGGELNIVTKSGSGTRLVVRFPKFAHKSDEKESEDSEGKD